MTKLFRGGTVVTGSGCKKADIFIEDGKIVDVADRICMDSDEIIDATGKYIFPGFIDGHTHLDLDVSNTVTIDDFDTGTKAEIAGGTTCIVDFATQNKGESLKEALSNWHQKAKGKSSCDYAFHLAISDWNKEVREELGQVVAEGIRSFKLYTTYDSMVVDDKTIYEILLRLKELGGIAGIHCENKGIIDGRLGELLKEKGNREDVSDYPYTRPPLCEAEAIHRVLAIAKAVDTPIIIVHLSSQEGFEAVQHARNRGQKVYVETCPQYLVLDDSQYDLPADVARNYMIAPPLRKKSDQDVLWRALIHEQIDTIATDHCSFTQEQKKMGAADFTKTPCGMPGAEERAALIYHYGVKTERISIEQMCRYLSENPAKLYGLYPKKGIIACGSDADLVLWNPDTEWIMTKEAQNSASDYCPMEGMNITGRAERVYLRGNLIAENGMVKRPYEGQYVKSEKVY